MTENRILGILFASLGCLTLMAARYLPETILGGEVGPSFFPKIWGGAIVLLGTMMFLTSFVEKKSIREGHSINELWQNYRYVVFCFILSSVYVLSMRWLGFLLSTSIFTPICIFMLEEKITKWLAFRAVLVTVCAVGLPYLFFTYVMQIILPVARW